MSNQAWDNLKLTNNLKEVMGKVGQIDEVKRQLGDIQEQFAEMRANVGKTTVHIDPETVPILSDPRFWIGGEASVTHRGTCPDQHEECALARWANAPGDNTQPLAMMHVERPPRFFHWENVAGAAERKWRWLLRYLPILANGNRSLEITKGGEADNQWQTDFGLVLKVQWEAQRNYPPPMPEDVGIRGTGGGFAPLEERI